MIEEWTNNSFFVFAKLQIPKSNNRVCTTQHTLFKAEWRKYSGYSQLKNKVTDFMVNYNISNKKNLMEQVMVKLVLWYGLETWTLDIEMKALCTIKFEYFQCQVVPIGEKYEHVN